LNTLIITYGMSIFLSNLARLAWTTEPKATSAPANIIKLWGTAVSVPRIISSLFALFVVIILYLFLKITPTGKAIRAVSQNREGALAIGIDVSYVSTLAFGIGIGLSCLAGTLVSEFFASQPYMGTSFVVLSFAIIILGGMGSFKGLLAGAVVLSFISQLGSYLIGSAWRSFIFFLIIIIVLIIRPTGIVKTVKLI